MYVCVYIYIHIQTQKAYEVVNPSKAEVVFATVPLWSLLFAVNFLGEPAGERLVLGASLSTLASIIIIIIIILVINILIIIDNY